MCIQIGGFKWKKPQTLDLNPVVLISGCIGCTRSWVAKESICYKDRASYMCRTFPTLIQAAASHQVCRIAAENPRCCGRMPTRSSAVSLLFSTSCRSPSPSCALHLGLCLTKKLRRRKRRIHLLFPDEIKYIIDQFQVVVDLHAPFIL